MGNWIIEEFEYLSFVWCNIINITIGSYVFPNSIQGIKITDEFQSSSRTCIRTAGRKIAQIRNSKPQSTVKKDVTHEAEIGTRKYFCTASINLARMTDSIWDSASVKRWFKHLFQAPKLPRVLECLRSLIATL